MWGCGEGTGLGCVQVGERCNWSSSTQLGQFFGESGFRVSFNEGLEAAQWALGREGVVQMDWMQTGAMSWHLGGKTISELRMVAAPFSEI